MDEEIGTGPTIKMVEVRGKSSPLYYGREQTPQEMRDAALSRAYDKLNILRSEVMSIKGTVTRLRKETEEGTELLRAAAAIFEQQTRTNAEMMQEKEALQAEIERMRPEAAELWEHVAVVRAMIEELRAI